MKRPLAITTGIVALSLALLSGCSQPQAGNPAPSPTSSGAASAAPRVSNPLDPSAYVGRPCDLVPPQLVSQLGFSDPTPTDADSPFGPGCGWIDVSGAKPKNLSVGLQILRGERNGGLSAVYRTRDAGGYAYADPTDLSGYPAVFADTQDRRAQGKCSVYVGIADDLTFSAGVDGYSGQQDSCAAAEQVAAAVITTLQGGS
ncbi:MULTISPECIES: DUF3558 domain-containing protein [Amycolatopsis]|uniref:DUF3558 domain-containing protein n=2 Tax=Amycolatopsis TaxID=1813 RepID=A0A1I3M6L1_9PSEU|nr:DUF3558 domain-containing protein [Amycolatopsis sacchari]SFI92631.1 Protein of unknown function [Amycolatopsis sacchari]